jgi:hypothetical protein
MPSVPTLLVTYIPAEGMADQFSEATGPVFINLQNQKVGVYTPGRKKLYVEPWSEKGRIAGAVYAVRGAHYTQFAGRGGPLVPFSQLAGHRRTLPNGAAANPADPRDGKPLVENRLAAATEKIAAARRGVVTPKGFAVSDMVKDDRLLQAPALNVQQPANGPARPGPGPAKVTITPGGTKAAAAAPASSVATEEFHEPDEGQG